MLRKLRLKQKKRFSYKKRVLLNGLEALIAMEYILIHAIKSTNNIIHQGWLLDILKDRFVQKLPLFLFKGLLVQNDWLFNSMDVFQVTIVRSNWQQVFF